MVLDPVVAIMATGTILYIVQAVALSGKNPYKMLQRIVKDTTLGFVILLVTAISAQYYMVKIAENSYPIMAPIIGVVIGITLGRKIENFFSLG